MAAPLNFHPAPSMTRDTLHCCSIRSGQAQVLSNTGLLQGDLLSFDCDSIDDNFEYDVCAPTSVQEKGTREGSTGEGVRAGESKRIPGFFDSLIIMSDSASSAPSDSSSKDSDKDSDSASSEIDGSFQASHTAPAPVPTPVPVPVDAWASVERGAVAARRALLEGNTIA